MAAIGSAVHVVLFEDEFVGRLFPITIGRAAYAITCGGKRLVDWVHELSPGAQALVRPHLAEVQRADFPELNAVAADDATVLFVNARAVPSVGTFAVLKSLRDQNRAGVVWQGRDVAAAVILGASDWALQPALTDLLRRFKSPEFTQLPKLDGQIALFDHPHDVVRHNLTILRDNLEYRLKHESRFREVAEGVFVAEGVTLASNLITDTRSGPILVEEKASVGPFCYLRGPVLLGRSSRVIEHAAIKDAVSIGHTTKIGGEVEASVIEPYSNKQHHGFLGHSYLGSWINLGAGTCNSDLKNTYGEVKMEYRGEKVATGMQFLGCAMGDYAKTAINTGIFTGKVVGACSMLYGFITTNVPSFVSYARLFGQVTELPPDVMIATQQRMFSRRNVCQRLCDMQLIRDMFELTRDERQQATEPMSL